MGSSGKGMRPVMGMRTSKSHDETECRWSIGTSAPATCTPRAAVGACARWQSAEAKERKDVSGAEAGTLCGTQRKEKRCEARRAQRACRGQRGRGQRGGRRGIGSQRVKCGKGGLAPTDAHAESERRVERDSEREAAVACHRYRQVERHAQREYSEQRQPKRTQLRGHVPQPHACDQHRGDSSGGGEGVDDAGRWPAVGYPLQPKIVKEDVAGLMVETLRVVVRLPPTLEEHRTRPIVAVIRGPIVAACVCPATRSTKLNPCGFSGRRCVLHESGVQAVDASA
eukprot:scaffold56534_cov60-Phaeocystis_antarctica.AAC.6